MLQTIILRGWDPLLNDRNKFSNTFSRPVMMFLQWFVCYFGEAPFLCKHNLVLEGTWVVG